ncbi:CD8B protein, partial [Chloroceryle aenea]|nr:CD8B protein [Chloroceryle aenea]
GFCTTLLLSQTSERILARSNNKTEILCKLTNEHVGVYWYRWNQERQKFEFLVYSNPFGKAMYGTNITQDKFSVRGASSQTSYSLYINNLHVTDSGTYYCSIFQSFQLFVGSGTQLSVVDVLPVPLKTTQTPHSKKKPMQCITKSRVGDKKGACSLLVWVPLVAVILVLLLSLVPIAHRLHRMRRRLWLRIHRQ